MCIPVAYNPSCDLEILTLLVPPFPVCGAAGGIGQPLSLLLKQSPLISHLSLFDIVNTPGVAADLRYVFAWNSAVGTQVFRA